MDHVIRHDIILIFKKLIVIKSRFSKTASLKAKFKGYLPNYEHN